MAVFYLCFCNYLYKSIDNALHYCYYTTNNERYYLMQEDITMSEQLTIKIKHGDSINVSCAHNPNKGVYFGLYASSASISRVLTYDLNLINNIAKKLKSLISDDNSGCFDKFEINEDEFIALGKYQDGIQIKVKSGGDFSKNGIAGFMTYEPAKTLANKLEEVLR